jgi:dipeptidyl aminopeptidase/acylaminoacyl peptidase
MTTVDRFERTVTEWLHEDADHHLPDHLGEVLAATATTRQRPAWSSLERWLPLDTIVRQPLAALPRPGRLLLAAALVVALLGLLLFAAGSSTHKPLLPYGLARNGTQLIGSGGDIFAVQPGGAKGTALIGGASFDFGPTWSRDGSMFTFLRAPSPPLAADVPVVLAVARADGSNIVELSGPLVGVDWTAWSPTGDRIAYEATTPSGVSLTVVDLATRAARVLTTDPISDLAWLPPAGNELIYRAGDTTPGIYAIRADGTGAPRLLTHRLGVAKYDYDSPAVAPDGTSIVFIRYVDSVPGTRLFVLDLATGSERQLPVVDGAFPRNAVFSPDSKQIAFGLSLSDGTYTAVVAPTDGSSTGRFVGPNPLMPSSGDLGLHLAFAPDGAAIIAGYDDAATNTTAAWWLPVDGSAGHVIDQGSFEDVDVQRLAP